MEKPYHRFSELFAQLGLASDASSIRAFIERHSPLDDATRLEDAPCWSQEKWLRWFGQFFFGINKVTALRFQAAIAAPVLLK